MKLKHYLASGLLITAMTTGAREARKPNIVIIMSDQQRADYCGREGFPLDITPYVDSIARQGAWFSNAYTSMPASSPARCSMFTGRYPNATHVRTNHNIADITYGTDLMDVLHANGYSTALVGKNHAYLKKSDFDFWTLYGHWGKESKPEYPGDPERKKFLNDSVGQSLTPSPIPVDNQQPSRIIDEALGFVDRQSADKPYFMWISFPEPHNPFQVCEPYFSMFNPDNIPANHTSRADLAKKTDKYRILAKLEDQSCPNLLADLPRLRANYMGMIRLIDDQIKRFIESIKQRGEWDNTIFIILSDHGDFCGEYGLIRKGAGLSESLTRIPMVWAGGGIKKQDGAMTDFVSITDIYPTLCTAIGDTIPLGVQGRSLWPMLTGENYPKEEFNSIMVQLGYGGNDVPLTDDFTFSQEGAIGNGIARFDELNTWTQSGMSRMVRQGDWKLIVDSRGNGELYNLKSDPYELNNLYESKKHIAQKCDMLNLMMKWELRLQDPLPVPRHRYKFSRNPYNYYSAE